MRNLFFIFILGIIVSACGSPESGKKDKLVIKTTAIGRMAVDSEQNFVFISQPYRSTDLSFRVSGIADIFDVQSGKYYRKGEIIAQIDPRDFIIRRERAEAIYNQTKAEFERIKVLFDKNNISASAYEKAKSDYISAKTAFQTASNDLDDTKLIAPFNGYAGEKYIERYQDVKATQPIVSFQDLEHLKIEAYVPQNIAAETQNLKTARVVFDVLPDKEFVAHIEQVSKSTTKNNLSYLITAKLANPGGELLSGMSGKIYFETGQMKNDALAVPLSAVCHRPTDGDYVWVVDTSTRKVSKRKIAVQTILTKGFVSVSGGLKENEVIAVSGLRFLSDGMVVDIDKETGHQSIVASHKK